MKTVNNVLMHRGIHCENIPENSIAAFKKCIEKNLSIELDIRQLKTKEIVVFHDRNLYRMTGYNKDITKSTYKEIKDLKLKNTKENIPLLKDVLKLVNGKVLINIEIKSSIKFDKKFLKNIVEILKEYEGEIIFTSFDYRIVYYLMKISNYEVGILTFTKYRKTFKDIRIAISKIILNTKILKPSFISCELYGLPIKEITNFRKKGGKICIWGIRNKEDLLNAKKYGDMFIIDDYKLL